MITNGWLRVIAWAAALVGAAAAIHVLLLLYQPIIRPILQVLLPFSVAVGLALLLDPTIDRLADRGMSRGFAVALVATSFLTAFVILAVFLVPVMVSQARELAGNLPEYYQQAEAETTAVMARNEGLLRRFHLPATMQELSAQLSGQAQRAASTSLANAGTTLAALISKAVWLVIIPIITVFLLIDIDTTKMKILLLAPERHRERTARIAGSIGSVFGKYIRGLITVSIFYGIACGLAIAAWGVPYAALLGAAAGALSLVPYIGTISTVLLVGLVAFVNLPSNPMHAVYVAVTILAINQVFDNAVSPRIVGKAVGIHPALAILALLIGAQLFGLVGMILAVPVAASIQLIALEFYPPLRNVDEKPGTKKPSLAARLLRRAKRSQ